MAGPESSNGASSTPADAGSPHSAGFPYGGDSGLQASASVGTEPSKLPKKRKRHNKKKRNTKNLVDSYVQQVSGHYVKICRASSDRDFNTIDETLVARCTIPEGTRIITDMPIFFTRNGDYTFLQREYASLTIGQRAAFFALPPVRTENLLRRCINGLIAYLLKVFRQDRWESERARLKKLWILINSMCLMWRIFSRIRSNRWAPNLSVDRSFEAMTCLIASRMNHSCCPNTFVQYNSNTGLITGHALREIRHGEPLTMSKLPQVWFSTRSQRANVLAFHHGNKRPCSCPDCNESGSPDRDAMSKMVAENYFHLKDFLTSVDRANNPEPYNRAAERGLGPTVSLCTSTPSEEGYRNAEKIALETLQYLRSMGCMDMELARWLGVLGSTICPGLEGKEDAACEHLQSALAYAEKCMGTDHPDYALLKAEKEKAKRRAHAVRRKKSLPVESKKQIPKKRMDKEPGRSEQFGQMGEGGRPALPSDQARKRLQLGN